MFMVDGVKSSNVMIKTLYNAGAGVKVQQYYDKFVSSINIMGVFNVSGEHTFVRDIFYSFYEKVPVGFPY